jgi:hypothetical protein
MAENSKVKAVIQEAPYLLANQKERLLKELDGTDTIDEITSPNLALEVVEEVFYKLLGVSVSNISVTERNDIKCIVKDTIGNPKGPSSSIWKD